MNDQDLLLEAIAERLGLKPEIRVLDTPQEMQAYLDERAQKAGLIQPCINPYCATDNGARATVDRRKKRSGACCKACMNYECTHPDCVAKAQAKGWKHHTHPWGSKIATEHAAYRKA